MYKATIRILAIVKAVSILGGCSSDAILGSDSRAFSDKNLEQKPASTMSSANAIDNRGAVGAAEIYARDFVIDVTLKSGLVLCKNGSIKLSIKEDLTFNAISVASLKCVSAQLDIKKLLEPMLDLFANIQDMGKFALQDNVLLVNSVPLMSGISFSPGVPLFFIPTIGDDSANAANIKRTYNMAAKFAPNSLNIPGEQGTASLVVTGTDTPFTDPSGKTFNKTVNWVIQSQWQLPGTVPLPTLMDVTWSSEPIDLLNLKMEIEINPKYLALLETIIGIQDSQPLLSGFDLDTNLTAVVSIHR